MYTKSLFSCIFILLRSSLSYQYSVPQVFFHVRPTSRRSLPQAAKSKVPTTLAIPRTLISLEDPNHLQFFSRHLGTTYSIRLTDQEIESHRSTMAQPTLTGSCLCTAVTFTSSSPPSHLDFCYCLTCRHASGAPFIAWSGIPKSSLTWSGPITTYHSSSIATRTFCAKCGSNLTIQYACYPDKTHVAYALVRRSDWEAPRVGVHIFVRDVPGWYGVPEDGVVRWEEFDGEFEGKFPEVVEALRREEKKV